MNCALPNKRNKGLIVLLGLWVWLGILVVIWKSFPSPLMNAVFHTGWVSMFVFSGYFLYQTSKNIRRR